MASNYTALNLSQTLNPSLNKKKTTKKKPPTCSNSLRGKLMASNDTALNLSQTLNPSLNQKKKTTDLQQLVARQINGL
jgi:hypothetical protein